MEDFLTRTRALLGEEKLNKLQSKKVIVFGVGGVGGYVVESLVRSGIKEIAIVDNDVVALSNINRQIIATKDNAGKKKVDLFEERIKQINQEANVIKYPIFYLNETADLINLKQFDYVVDAIDTVSAKILLVEKCKELNIPIISSMGSANKLDPSKLKITDISKTEVDPLAKVMRYELRKRGINHLKVCYSNEEPIIKKYEELPSISYLPAICGLMISAEVIKDLTKDE